MKANVVGKSIKRADAREKVTGTALYIDDLFFPRMLYMKVLRAGIPHAEIVSIDTREAESIDGVYKIVTRDTEGIDKNLVFGTCIFDERPLALDKVRHAGEVVAAVIAETEEIANKALKKIKIEYKELPFVTDALEAIKEDSPLIHEKNGEYFHLPTYEPIPGTNIFFKYHLKKGNYENPFEKAEVVVEGEFEYPLVNHAAIEPHGAIAYWDYSGELHLWSSSQAPFVLREVLSDMFKLPMNKIHISIPYLGGGFGGKSDYTIEPLLALVSKFVPGYYVKFILTREEIFTGTVLGRGMKGKMKVGAKKDGTLVGITAELYFSDGAYGDTGCNVVLAAGHNCVGPYYFPNCSLKSFGVYTNTPPVGAFRGYGHPEGQLMIEKLMEDLSKKLGIDPLELRKKNFLKPGQTNSLGQVITEHNGNIHQCFERMIEALYSQPLPEEDDHYLYGRGVAALVKSPVQAPNASSSVFLKFNEDMTVNISIGGVEMGQGCLTVLAQIAADSLMIPVEKVRINYEINTQLTPYEWQTVASMTTMRVGNAIIDACQKAIDIFKKNASQVLNCPITELEYTGKEIISKDHSIPLEKLVMGYMFDDGHTVGNPVMATGSSVVRDVTVPDENGKYKPYEWTFGSQGVDIRISKDTGEIKILRVVTVLDVGRVINPETAKGQVMGGVMQAIGQALTERIEFDKKGRVKNTNLRKYKIPKMSDMPEYTCIFLENEQPNGPFGARPMAEHPTIGIPPAILNALHQATGISLKKLPATPDKVLDILKRR